MNLLRIKNKYLFFSAISVFFAIYIFMILYNPNVIKAILFGWKLEPEFSSSYEYMLWVAHFDIFVLEGMKPFQIILPIIAVIPAMHFREEIYHYLPHAYLRIKKYRPEIIKSLLMNALIVSCVLYISYIIAITIGYILFPISNDVIGFGNLFDHILGHQFYIHYRLLYYILGGLFYIFIPTFIYNMFAMIMILYIEKKFLSLFLPIVYYFSLVFLIPILMMLFQTSFINQYLIYFAPQVIMMPEGIINPSLFMIFIGYFPQICLFIILLIKKLFEHERIGYND